MITFVTRKFGNGSTFSLIHWIHHNGWGEKRRRRHSRIRLHFSTPQSRLDSCAYARSLTFSFSFSPPTQTDYRLDAKQHDTSNSLINLKLNFGSKVKVDFTFFFASFQEFDSDGSCEQWIRLMFRSDKIEMDYWLANAAKNNRQMIHRISFTAKTHKQISK